MLLTCFGLTGQEENSLPTIKLMYSKINNAPYDTAHIKLLNSLSFAYYNESKFDSCQLFASKAIHLADSLLKTNLVKNNTDYQNRIKILKILAIRNIALGFQDSIVYKKIDTLEYALKLAKEIGDKNVEAHIYGTLGDAYSFKNQLQLSIKCYLLGVELLV